MPKLFVLRAYWTERWNDADDGLVDVAEVFSDIVFSTDPAPLREMRTQLIKGHGGGYWTEKRAKELRALWEAYEDMVDYTFKVEDISQRLLM